MKIGSLDWRIWAAAGAAVAVTGAVLASKAFSRPPDPDEIERTRRTRINRIGRIVEGHIVELMETTVAAVPTNGNGLLARRKSNGTDASQRKMLCYSYSISGVSYETAQDVTGLEERAALGRVAAGQPASVKYDPSNPSNSILVSDDWSGLH